MGRRTITIAGKKYIFIPGDKISQAEIIERIRKHKESSYAFQIEQIRTSDTMDPYVKQLRISELRWKLQALKRERERTY